MPFGTDLPGKSEVGRQHRKQQSEAQPLRAQKGCLIYDDLDSE